MTEIGTLASAALSSALAYLGSKAVEVADDLAKAAGAAIVDWLKSKLVDPGGKAALEALEADPDSRGAQKMLEGALEARLEQEPSLAKELGELLAAAGPQTTTSQTMRFQGGNNAGAQVAGDKNTVKIGRD